MPPTGLGFSGLPKCEESGLGGLLDDLSFFGSLGMLSQIATCISVLYSNIRFSYSFC